MTGQQVVNLEKLRDEFQKKMVKRVTSSKKMSQNHSFSLPKKNDICGGKEGVKSSCHGFFSE